MTQPSSPFPLISALKEPGGLTLRTGVPFVPIKDLLGAKVSVTAGTGSGMAFLLCELVCQALATGAPVRVLDLGGTFKALAARVGGLHLSSWQSALWADKTNSFVVFDLANTRAAAQPDILAEVAATPEPFWLLANEAWDYGDLPRADCIASPDAIPRPLQLVGRNAASRLPLTLSESAIEFISTDRAPGHGSAWVLTTEDGVETQLQLETGACRTSLFDRRAVAR